MLRIMFYLVGKNGLEVQESASDISKRLLRRGKIEATVRPNVWNIKRLLLINDLKVMNLALSYV